MGRGLAARLLGVGGAEPTGEGWGRGARGLGEGGAAARGWLWRPECHTRGGSGGGGSGSCRRRRDGYGRTGSGGRRLSPYVACSSAAGSGSPQRSRNSRRGAEDPDKFAQQPRIPAKAEAAAPTGQQRAPRRNARPERPRPGTPGPFALRGAVGWDPMRRAREGREIPSPGGARRRRRAVLQLLEPGSCRQEAAERT